jgi:hypothetical protein
MRPLDIVIACTAFGVMLVLIYWGTQWVVP